MKKSLFLLPLCVASIGAQTTLSARQNAVVPVFDASLRYLIGGSQNGKWLDAKTTAQSLRAASKLRVFSATRALGNGNFTAPKSQGAPCEDTLFSDITPDLSKRKFVMGSPHVPFQSPDFARSNAQFALGGAHNPFPRQVRIESPNQATYRGIVAATLRAHGIAKPVVQIAQIWRVDLDGDGTTEVLLSATRKADGGNANIIAPDSRAGDYSLVLLRKIVSGRAKNILMASEFYPRAKTFNAPNFFRLAAVFDADGDGKMEVLLRGRYYEGDSTALFSVGAEKPREVLSEGCGA